MIIFIIRRIANERKSFGQQEKWYGNDGAVYSALCRGRSRCNIRRSFEQIPLMVIGIIWASLGWIPFLGLKVLKPQEALVLTLFGKYVGTLKNDGFYWVNPFCTAVNPAAKTKLNQSGDVDGGNAAKSVLTLATGTSASTSSTYVNKKISLKIMTLNNNRQKINDCLGNPVEIGIAVMWRVTDTAKAVFNVDNYKEYLSLQCDSALRNIVRITLMT